MTNLLAPTTALLALIATSVASTAALADEKVTPLIAQTIGDGLEGNIVLLEVDPGFETERHLHPGDVFLYVMEGSIEILLDGREPIRVSAGEVVHEEPNTAMVGRNVSSTEGARLLVFQIGKAGEPLEIPLPK